MHQTVKMCSAAMISNNERNEIYDFLHGLSKFIYIIGGPNFWPGQLKIPNLLHKVHKPLSIFMYLLGILIILLEAGALCYQIDLSEKQKCDLLIFSSCHPVLYCYLLNAEYYADIVKEMFRIIAIDSKSFNDKETERDTMKRIKYFCGFCLSLFGSAMILYGVDGLLQVLKHDGAFTTIIIAWPDMHDHSKVAGVVRVLVFIAWWIFMLQVSVVSYCLAIPATICLSHQFKNLKSYFYSLNDIFNGNEDQKEKEQRYEKGFQIGIQWHADILRCTALAQKSLAVIFGGQIVMVFTAFSVLLLQFVNSERTITNTFVTIISIVSTLFSTGCFMWNAGDVPVEAFTLPTAMFESGWHNCRTKPSLKLRSMITIAMWQSQRPVQLRCFGVVQISYASYVTIVKSSYSLFSVLY